MDYKLYYDKNIKDTKDALLRDSNGEPLKTKKPEFTKPVINAPYIPIMPTKEQKVHVITLAIPLVRPMTFVLDIGHTPDEMRSIILAGINKTDIFSDEGLTDIISAVNSIFNNLGNLIYNFTAKDAPSRIVLSGTIVEIQ